MRIEGEANPGPITDIYAYLERMEREQPPFSTDRLAKIVEEIQRRVPEIDRTGAEFSAKVIYANTRIAYSSQFGVPIPQVDTLFDESEKAVKSYNGRHPHDTQMTQWYEREVDELAKIYTLPDEQRKQLLRNSGLR